MLEYCVVSQANAEPMVVGFELHLDAVRFVFDLFTSLDKLLKVFGIAKTFDVLQFLIFLKLFFHQVEELLLVHFHLDLVIFEIHKP